MNFAAAPNRPVRLAAQESRGHRLILEILIFFAVFLAGSTVQGLILFIPESAALLASDAFREILSSVRIDPNAVLALINGLPAWLYAVTLFSTAALIAAAVLYCRLIEKRSLDSMGIVRAGAFREYLAGLVIGLALMAAAVGICCAFGGIRLEPAAGTRWWMIAVLFLGFLVQGMAEELLCRGYLCVSVARRAPVAVAVGVSAAVFALLHISNSGLSVLALVNLFLFGAFAGIYFLWRGSIWGAAAIHSMWNFAQGNLFGIPVSGTAAGDSVLRCISADELKLWNGGSFGLEGSLAVTLVLLIAISCVLFIHLSGSGRKKVEQ